MTSSRRVSGAIRDMTGLLAHVQPSPDPLDAAEMDQAIHDMQAALADLHRGIEPCLQESDGYGWCRDCGARLAVQPHRRGGKGICGLLVAAPVAAAAVAALARRVWVRVETRL